MSHLRKPTSPDSRKQSSQGKKKTQGNKESDRRKRKKEKKKRDQMRLKVWIVCRAEPRRCAPAVLGITALIPGVAVYTSPGCAHPLVFHQPTKQVTLSPSLPGQGLLQWECRAGRFPNKGQHQRENWGGIVQRTPRSLLTFDKGWTLKQWASCYYEEKIGRQWPGYLPRFPVPRFIGP